MSSPSHHGSLRILNIHDATASLAGILAELGIGEVVLNGAALQSRGGVNLPGAIARHVEDSGSATLQIGPGRGELIIGRDALEWRRCDPELDHALRSTLGTD